MSGDALQRDRTRRAPPRLGQQRECLALGPQTVLGGVGGILQRGAVGVEGRQAQAVLGAPKVTDHGGTESRAADAEGAAGRHVGFGVERGGRTIRQPGHRSFPAAVESV